MILRAIKNAYRIKAEDGWDTIYWAIDLHGVCLRSTYHTSEYEWINPTVIEGLREINSHEENKIIIWSGVHPNEKLPIRKFFAHAGIKIDFFNCNPLEDNTDVGNFVEKFYFNILLDDKAGFDPDTDWQVIIDYYKEHDELRLVEEFT